MVKLFTTTANVISLVDTLSLDVATNLSYEHILSVLVGICKVCKNITVVMDYVSENLIKIFKDADCS